MRVIVTRAAAQAASWVGALQQAGLRAQALPLIGIQAAPDPAAVRASWARLPGLAMVIFVSANAVQHFFAARPAGATWPAGLVAGSTGPGTSAALRSAGVLQIEEPAADAAEFDSEALWARLRARRFRVEQGPRGRRAGIVPRESGLSWWFWGAPLHGFAHAARLALVSALDPLRPRCAPSIGAGCGGGGRLAHADPRPAGRLEQGHLGARRGWPAPGCARGHARRPPLSPGRWRALGPAVAGRAALGPLRPAR